MADEILISDIVDLGAITGDIDKLLGQINRVDKAIQDVNGNKLNVGNIGGLKDLKQATDSLNTATEKLTDALKGNVKTRQNTTRQQLDEIQKLEQAEKSAYEKRQAAGSEQAQSATLERERLRERNLELKNNVIASSAAEGSIQQMRAQLSLLSREYDKLSEAERNSAKGTDLQQKIKGQADALFKLESETGRYSRNVGNYTQATKILEQSLEEVKIKMDELRNSGQGNGEAFQKFEREEQLLNQILEKNVGGFSSLTREIRANEQALAGMFQEGLAGTEAYKKLEVEISNAKRELGEFKEQQKILSSQTPAIAAATLAAKGLAGAYAVGAGAAALFADGDEKVQKELQKLVAIMTVLQGLQEVHELLEKRGTIAKVASAAADKLSTIWIAAKNFALRGSVSANVASAASTTLNTTATEGATLATRFLTGSLVGLRVALLATGIGALLLLIPVIANAMSKASKETDNWGNRLDRLKKINPELAESLEELGKTIEDVADNYIKKLKDASKDLREELGLIPSDVKKATEIINGLISKRGELEKSLAAQNLQPGSKRTINFGDVFSVFGIGQSSADREAEINKINKKIADIQNNFNLEQLQKSRELGAKNLERQKSDALHFVDIDEQLDVAKLKAKGATEKQIFDVQQKFQKQRIGLIEVENKIAVAGYQAQLDAIRQNSPWNTDKISELQGKINGLNQETSDANNKLLVDQYNFKAQHRQKDQKQEKDYSEDVFKQQKELSDRQFELRNRRRQQDINDDKQVVDDEKETLAERLKAQELFYNDSLQKLNAERQKALDDSFSKTEDEKRIVQRELNNKSLTTKQRRDLQEELTLIEKNGDLERLSILADFDQKSYVLTKSNSDRILEVKIKEIEKEKAALADQHDISLGDISNRYEKEQQELEESFAKGEITERQYNKKKLDIQEQFNVESLKKDIEYTKAIIELAEVRANTTGKKEDQDAVIKAKQSLIALEIKLGKTVAEYQIETNKQTNDDDEKAFNKKMQRLQKYSAYAKEVFDIVGGFVSANVDKQKNIIQDQIDLLDKKTQKELEGVSQSTASEQSKANQIAIINARAAAQKEALQRRQQQLDQQKARFEKAQNIASIIMETSLAVVRALGDKAIPGPARIVEAVVIGTLGAAQLAKAIATPIPRYFRGKNVDAFTDLYEGPALLNDGGKKEAIIRENGTVEVPHEMNVVKWVGSKDIVLPDAKMLAWNATATVGKQPSFKVNNSIDITGLISEQQTTNRHLKALRNKPVIKMYNRSPLDDWMSGKINTEELF